MRMQEFFDYYNLTRNPFADEEAQSDPIFKQKMSRSVFHPAWDKIFGRPEEVGTAIVFGEKGSGKTALRLQIKQHLELYNQENPNDRMLVVQYDDFNPLLDRFNQSQNNLGRECLKSWSLWDHMDSILSLGVSALVDRITTTGRLTAEDSSGIDLRRAKRIHGLMKRDLLLLAAYYDRSPSSPFLERWGRLASRLGFSTLIARWPKLLGMAGTALTTIIAGAFYQNLDKMWFWVVLGIMLGASWFTQLKRMWNIHRVSGRIAEELRVMGRNPHELTKALAGFKDAALSGQPMPMKGDTDARYQLLSKFQAILKELGFRSIIVIMDRVDEPQLINGAPEAMRDFVWPMLDNKFLKYENLGLKLLLPIELWGYLQKETKEFYERSRLDKQNTVSSLKWSGQALYDLASERLSASLPEEMRSEGKKLLLREIIAEEVSTEQILRDLDELRVPRHLFKFLYRLVTEHCNEYTSEKPVWKIGLATFRSVLKLYLRDLEAFDRGYGHG